VPLYDYDCAACGRRFEVIHGVHDPAPERCPLCGEGPVRKAIAAPAIHFKGSGWAKKERRAAVKSGSSSSEDSDSSEKSERSEKTEKTEKTEKIDTGGKAGEKSRPAEPGSSSNGAGPSSSTSTTASSGSSD
jgi:putative FmdB family regulatory protein